MKKAGIDVGSSLTKVAFKNDDGVLVFLSTADYSLEFIIQELKRNGIEELNVCGINTLPENFNSFKIVRPSGDLIDNEIKFQAIGAHKLLTNSGYDRKDFLLVSIGTGTSYTFVNGATATRFPIGNSLGGGFMRGLAHQLNIENGLWDLECDTLSDVESLDILVKDLISGTAGAPIGELIVANFGKIDRDKVASIQAKQRALINVVATAISRDIIILNMFRGLTSKYAILWLIGFLLKMNSKSNSIVVIGSVVQKCSVIREKISANCKKHLGVTPVFPENSAFALALGCMCSK